MIHPTPRLRFAPSPTGPLHLGGARTAMYNWALCRSLGGTFVLRIEDTDQARSSDASLQVILEGLAWLGIDWDEGPAFLRADGAGENGGGDFGPYFQMQRLDRYRAALDKLIAGGHAYRCYCSPERLDEVRARQKAEKSAFLGYDGHCRELSDAQRAQFEADGVEPNVRFRMPKERLVEVHDLIRGDVEVQTSQLDDWVMMRPGGVPLYNFACVVDDVDMQITHVVRGEEHFLNGIKQRLVFEALGHECPEYAHIPLILNQQGQKLSKRDPGVKSVLEYRDLGYPPEAVFNYIALLGWGFSADRDVFSRDEMVEVFEVGNVGKAGARFDPDKLHWMCGEYIRGWTADACCARARPWLEPSVGAATLDSHGAYWCNAVALFQARITLLAELPVRLAWLGAAPVPDEDAVKSLHKHAERKPDLLAFADHLAALDPPLPPGDASARGGLDDAIRLPIGEHDDEITSTPYATPQAIERATRAFLAERGLKFGQLVQPVRALLTGTTKGPGFFDIVWLLGRDAVLSRLRAFAG